MCDCSTCAAFGTTSQGPVLPCGAQSTQTGTSSQKPAGKKQYPLLHLIYKLTVELQKPTPRKVRTIWLAPKINKGGSRYYRWYEFKQSVVEHEIAELVGMLLAQRVRTLSLWGLMTREDQEKLTKQLLELLYAPADGFDPSNGLALGSLERQLGGLAEAGEGTLAARAMAAAITNRQAMLEGWAKAGNGDALDKYFQALVKEQIHLVQGKVERLAQQGKARLNSEDDFNMWRRAEWSLLKNRRALAPPDANEGVLAELDERIEYYEKLSPQAYFTEVQEDIDYHRRECAMLAEPRQFGMKDVEQEWKHLKELLTKWQQRAIESNVRDQQQAETDRSELLDNWLNDDFSLQESNYPSQLHATVNLLKQALAASATAKLLFLGLHPALKYRWTAQTMCKMARLLSDDAFLSTHAELSGRGLVAPGRHARLGVFVMNSLSPGSYDQRHRGMVQAELDGLVTAMHEFGAGDKITCHSCGAERFGDASLAGRSGWVRDHNPPTALVELSDDGKDIGLPLYSKKMGATARQILLPQCMRCSAEQSSIVNKVAELLSAMKIPKKADAFDVRRRVMAKLTADERASFVRLVLNPGVGWSDQGQSGGKVDCDGDGNATVSWTKGRHLYQELVTTGKTGSFAGVDDDMLEELGNTHGCHTCVDVPNQTDAYRGMSWIADHQPPTALVERGLAELPQIVYPHCHACSKAQSIGIRKLVSRFDACFGKEWSTEWNRQLKALGYDDV